MATIYRCDRCKEDQVTKLGSLVINSYNDVMLSYEICDTCSSDLRYAAKHLPPKNKIPEPTYLTGNKDEEKDDISS